MGQAYARVELREDHAIGPDFPEQLAMKR